jgi:hypothetical protein
MRSLIKWLRIYFHELIAMTANSHAEHGLDKRWMTVVLSTVRFLGTWLPVLIARRRSVLRARRWPVLRARRRPILVSGWRPIWGIDRWRPVLRSDRRRSVLRSGWRSVLGIARWRQVLGIDGWRIVAVTSGRQRRGDRVRRHINRISRTR